MKHGKIKVAVIGCGDYCKQCPYTIVLGQWTSGDKVFCDIIPERAQAAVEKYGCGIAVQDYRDILDDEEVTAVSVCTPQTMYTQIFP